MSALNDYLKIEASAILNTAHRLNAIEVEKALELLKKSPIFSIGTAF